MTASAINSKYANMFDKLASWREACNAPNLPNAKYLPTVGLSPAVQLDVLPLNVNSVHADVIVTIEADTTTKQSDTFQIYSEEGVFHDHSNHSHVEMPYAPEVRSVLKLYSISASEQSLSKAWATQALMRLGVSESDCETLLLQAPSIKEGLTRPYLRPDETAKRVVFGRHAHRSQVHVSIANLETRIEGLAVSFEQLKVYVASLAMNLTTEQPVQLKKAPLKQLELRFKFTPLEQQVRPQQSTAMLLENAKMSDTTLPSAGTTWNSAISNIVMSRERESANAMRHNVLLARVGVFKAKNHVTFESGATASVRMSMNARSKRTKIPNIDSEFATESLRNNLKRQMECAVILNMTARKSMRSYVAGLASLDTASARTFAAAESNSQHTFALACILRNAIFKSDAYTSSEDGWALVLRLLYGVGKPALSSHDLIDHMMAGLTALQGPVLVLSVIKGAYYSAYSLKIDRSALDKVGADLALVGDDIVLAVNNIRRKIMDGFRERYQRRASSLAAMVKNPQFVKLAQDAGQAELERAIVNAKSNLIVAQWRAALFYPENFAEGDTGLIMNPNVRAVWRKQAQAFVIKRSGHGYKSPFNGDGKLAGKKRIDVVEAVETVINEGTDAEAVADVVDDLIGASFKKLLVDVCGKYRLVTEDLSRLTGSYERQIKMLERLSNTHGELDEYVDNMDPAAMLPINDPDVFLTNMLELTAFTGVNVNLTNRDVLRMRASLANLPGTSKHLITASKHKDYVKKQGELALEELMGSLAIPQVAIMALDEVLTLPMLADEVSCSVRALKKYLDRREITYMQEAPYSINVPRCDWDMLTKRLRSDVYELVECEKSDEEEKKGDVKLASMSTNWRVRQ